MKEKGMENRREKFEKRYPKWEKRTLYEQFLEIARQTPQTPFFIEKRGFTYEEILGEVHRCTRSLKAQGINEGDRVVLSIGNSVQFVCLTFALAALGGVKVPINRNIGSTEFKYILCQIQPKILFTDDLTDSKYIKEVPSLKQVVYVGSGNVSTEDIISWNKFLEGSSDKMLESWYQNADAVSDIIYTSGSTGHPKGAMLSHDMLLRSAHASCINRGFEDGRRIFIPIPLYHVYGYVEGMLTALLVNGSIVVSRGKFSPDRALAIMEKTEVNDILAIPFIISKILKEENLDRYRLDHLHAVYCSASICPSWVWDGIKKRLHVEEITTGYGMTEVCGATVQNDPLCDIEVLEHYLGKVLYGGCAGISEASGNIIQYKVIDPQTHREAEPMKSGELICKGPVVMKGYFKQDGENARVFERGEWFRTGDIGYFTEEGYLKLLGRKNDSYKINGENVSPQFLDYVIGKCPEVVAVETVGVPNERLGYSGAAFIEPTVFDVKTEQKIIDYCKQELASFQVPGYFFFEREERWERTSSGKVKKYKLREIAQERIRREKQK